MKMSGEYKRLYRSRSERMIGGVCGGLGLYFGIDPTLVRILFIVMALLGGHGLIVYLILLVIVPEEPLTIGSPSETVIEATPKTE
jgi:phage shock protein C